MKLIDTDVLKEWVENWFIKNRFYHLFAKNNNIPITELYDILEQMPSAQPEYYDYSDIDDVWEFYAEGQDINLTDGAKQLKDAMWVGYQKGKQDAQPEIIRCENCKYKQQCHKAVQHTIHEPSSVTIEYKKVDFCSYGKRTVSKMETVGKE